MWPRYIVRQAQIEDQYSVWDNPTNSAAVIEHRACANLTYEDAFKIANNLNAPDMQPKAE
jgi:hypothetical protein